MARKPKVGSRAWEMEKGQTLEYAKNSLKSLLPGAMSGKAEHIELLMGQVNKWPELRSLVPALDAMGAKTERAWFEKLSGRNQLAEIALKEEIEALKAELLPESPSELERVLVSTVIVARLSFEYDAWLAAKVSETPSVNAAREHRLGLATKRLYAAIRNWELYTGKKAKGVPTKRPLKIFQPAGKVG